MSETLPTFNLLYIHDTSGKVLCGECLSDEFTAWPDDWSEVPVAVEWQYACDSCGRTDTLSGPRN